MKKVSYKRVCDECGKEATSESPNGQNAYANDYSGWLSVVPSLPKPGNAMDFCSMACLSHYYYSGKGGLTYEFTVACHSLI